MKVKEESKNVGLKLSIQKTKIITSGSITSWHIDGEEKETVTEHFSWAPKSLWTMAVVMKLKMLTPWKKSCDKPRHRIKKHRHHMADKDPYSQSYGFSNSHVQMWP